MSTDREVTLFQQAVLSGDAGLVGVDSSGNDPEFPQNIGIVSVDMGRIAILESEE